jgi:mono/diheme cytochrome c family protein
LLPGVGLVLLMKAISSFRFGVLAVAALPGCNSFDPPPDGDPGQPRLVVPVDNRPAVRSEVPPVPVSGGTLEITADGALAVASDPDRDAVHIVDLATRARRHSVRLSRGAEPGRIAIENDHLAHVALRRAGAIATIDLVTGSIHSIRDACHEPRGLALDPVTGVLHVACAEGKVVSLAPGASAPERVLALEPGLRDISVHGSELRVTQFKSAGILRVDVSGSVIGRLAPHASTSELGVERSGASEFRTVALTPSVAWRARTTADGTAVIVHQEGVEDEIELSEPSANGSAYGGSEGPGCGAIVRNRVTFVAPHGAVRTGAALLGGPLPVDVAASPDGAWIAVAHAGVADPDAPRPHLVFPESHGGDFTSGARAFSSSGVAVFSRAGLETSGTGACEFPEGNPVPGPAVAVAFTPDGALVAQTREPAALVVLRDVPWGTPVTIPLSDEPRADTGHDLFHRDSGGGIACASCHPEGAEDGRVWRFSGIGDRRSQALHVGLEGTAPFHWDGDLDTLGALMDEVFVGRMGGVRQSAGRLQGLTDWLFSLEPPRAPRDADDPVALRGRALFHSEAVGCATCHAGSRLTNNESVDVGTAGGRLLQVPSLVAVGYRAPFMHDGCATTLADRFDPACGGSAHGHLDGLGAEDIASLVAYLETL